MSASGCGMARLNRSAPRPTPKPRNRDLRPRRHRRDPAQANARQHHPPLYRQAHRFFAAARSSTLAANSTATAATSRCANSTACRSLRTSHPSCARRPKSPPDEHGFDGEISGRQQSRRDNKAFIQFHYDLSNDFYALFLDPEMVYSCAYFTDWQNDIATAQHDKLEMICRKLRLKPGDRFLDVGAGWGGLVCHAATLWCHRARHHAV